MTTPADACAEMCEKLLQIVEEQVALRNNIANTHKNNLDYLIGTIREEHKAAEAVYNNMKEEGLTFGQIEAEGYLRAFKLMVNFINDM